MKKTIVYILILALMLGAFAGCDNAGKGSGDVTDTPQVTVTAAPSTATPLPATPLPAPTKQPSPTPEQANNQEDGPDEQEPARAELLKLTPERDVLWTGMTAAEIVAKMGVGFNLGNTFDATGGKGNSNIYAQETSWGNPQASFEQIYTIAEAGFKTIRIPITWMNHIDEGNNYAVDEAWFARIKEVVDYAYDCGLVVIINAHHESWINKKDLDTEYVSTGEELGALWTQIADYFADYDQHLVFEVMNEPRCAGTGFEWTGSASAYDAINYLNDIAVNVIRASHKGYNDERAIMIPDYAAQSQNACMAKLEIPLVNGEPATNIIASIHGYTPYDFCLSDKQKDFDLSKSSHTKPIDDMFANIDRYFCSKGIPAVLGETGATNTKDNLAARENWAWYISSKGAEYGIPVVLWDNGSTGKSGGECHAYLARRKTGTWYYPSIIANFVGGAMGAGWGGSDTTGAADNASGTVKNSSDMSEVAVIWSNAEGLTSTSEWNMEYIKNASDVSFYPEGGEILVIYTGSGEPKLMMDSEVKMQWWMPMDAEWTESSGGRKIAHFSVAGAKELIETYGVEEFADLRNLCVLATNGSITTYEVKAVNDADVCVRLKQQENKGYLHGFDEGYCQGL